MQQPSKRSSANSRSPFSTQPVRKSVRSRLPAFFQGFSRSPKRGFPMRFVWLYALLTLGVFAGLAVVVVYFSFLHGLPAIEDIERDALPESSVIYDRNGGELYKLYSGENRTYVPYAQISPLMRKAIVSTEDKTFFENPGVDLRGLVRSTVNFAFGKTDKIQGTSTISQQLIKNTFLTNERSMERKLKEIYLSYRLNSKYSKEKILELYLNKISFGNNAYGIEEASKAYFGKSAKDVQLLGSTILASLPKGPTYYSPYSHRDRLMGYLYVHPIGDDTEKVFVDPSEKGWEKKTEYAKYVLAFEKVVGGFKIDRKNTDEAKVCGLSQDFLKKEYAIDSDGCSDLAYKDLLGLLNDIRIGSGTLVALGLQKADAPGSAKPSEGSGSSAAKSASGSSAPDYVLEYNTGRKDFVAGRLLEDGHITGDEYVNKVVIGGLRFGFEKYSGNIKYPHFVFYVKDYLEQKYGQDFEAQWGLKIYTTIDPKLQDKAESVVRKQVAVNKAKYGANSAALVSMDNRTGQILAMVGGPDYFDEENGGNVNMVTAKRQPGSSFKPIVYALAMSKEAVGPDTPVYDLKTKFGKWEPDNYDRSFLGLMSVRKALDYSRNIPAIKMLWVAGGESSVVKFARSLGISSLVENAGYGAPLAIGTGELKPLELLSAYGVFANQGWKKDVVPILRIEDRKGNVIDRFDEKLSTKKYVFSDAASYLLSVILSDAKSRPSDFWNNVLTLPGRPVAAKTGTSNKDVSVGKEKKILPRDLWTAGYTPQITTVVWAGNVDGTETKGTCDGLNCAAPIWHDFMAFAHGKDGLDLPVEPFNKPDSVYTATISRYSGKLAGDSTPAEHRVTSMFAVKPTSYDGSAKQVEVDTLCNGKVTEATPIDAIKKGYLMNANPIVESYDPTWLAPIRTAAGSFLGEDRGDFIAEYEDKVCERPGESLASFAVTTNLSDGALRQIGPNAVSVEYETRFPVTKIKFERDGELFKEVAIEGEKTSGSWSMQAFDFDEAFLGEHELSVVVVDKYGYQGRASVPVKFWRGNNVPPAISVTNPPDGSVKIYEGQFFNLRFTVSDTQEIVANNLYLDGKLVKILGGGNEFAVAVNEGKDISVGGHVLTVESIDARRAKSKTDVSLEVLPK